MKVLGIVSALAVIVAAPAFAQSEPQTPEVLEQTAQLNVYDADGNVVGAVQEITIDENGVEYATIAVGDHLGLGAKQIRVPLSELTLRDDASGYDTAMTFEEIDAAPAFEQSDE